MIQLMKTTLLAWLCLTWSVALIPSAARAQGFFNMEFINLYGATPIRSQVIPGTNVTVRSTVIIWQETGYAYQVSRWKAAGLWAEFFAPSTYLTSPESRTTNNSDTVQWDSGIFAPGLRIMAPVQKRVSIFGAAGGGIGFFAYPELIPGPPTVLTRTAIHGVFDFGGGVDVRLNRRLSIRFDARDTVTGRGLSGVAGRNHPVALGGLVVHF